MGGGVRIPENRDPLGHRDGGDQELESLGGEIGHQDSQSRDVAAWPGKARNVAGRDWICVS